MREAVIVATARTPIGRAYRGAFNATPSPTLAAHAIRAAVERSGVAPDQIQDVVIGAALQQGVQATIGRPASGRTFLPGRPCDPARAGTSPRTRPADAPSPIMSVSVTRQ